MFLTTLLPAAGLLLLSCQHCLTQVVEIGRSDLPGPLKALARAPYVERMIAEIFQIFIMSPKDVGSFDLQNNQEALVY
jgi:magnesium-protoporphyrin IX monomethyl ester (oxidative) cyclase